MFINAKQGCFQAAMELLETNSELNHFILGDIRRHTLSSPMIDLWADMDGSKARAALLRYGRGFVLYAPEELDEPSAQAILKSHGYGALSGQRASVEKLMGRLNPPRRVRDCSFAMLEGENFRPVSHPFEVLRINGGNIGEYVQAMRRMRETITEFSVPLDTPSVIRQCVEGSQRAVAIMDGAVIAAQAMTSVELEHQAMVVGVCTSRPYRQKGLATAMVSDLCADLLAEQKKCLLFWENPAAGRIYLSLGFQEIDHWRMVEY